MHCLNTKKNHRNNRKTLQINIDQSQFHEKPENHLQSQQSLNSQQDSNTSQLFSNSNTNPSQQIDTSQINSCQSAQPQANNQHFMIHNTYSSSNHDYLILQNQSIDSNQKQPIKNLNQNHSISHPHQIKDDIQKQKIKSTNHFKQSMSQLLIQKDPEVEKIIHEVLIKRKQKEKQRTILQNIINPNIKAKQNSVSFVQKQKLSISKQKNKNNFKDSFQQSFKQDYQIKSKCRQLELKIKLLTKKKEHYERQKDKQDQQKMQKKTLAQMSKRQISLQKLKTRLEKALNLNANLTKRLKLQKSKLSSILLQSNLQIIVSQKKSIKNDSTLKIIEKNTQMNNSETQKISDTFRSNLTDDDNSPDKKKSQFSPSCQEKINNSKIIDLLKRQKKYINVKQTGKEKKCKICMKMVSKNTKGSLLESIEKKQPSQYEYNSPILQYNSYLIERSEKVSRNLKKDNIYIQNEMNFQQDNAKKVVFDKIKKQVGKMVQKFTLLEQTQQQLIGKIQANARKIKQYEDQHYIQVIQSL